MGMTNTVRELKDSMGNVMDVVKRKLGEQIFDDDDVMDIEFYELMRSVFHMCDLAMVLLEQQAMTLEGIDGKLDKLLTRKDEA